MQYEKLSQTKLELPPAQQNRRRLSKRERITLFASSLASIVWTAWVIGLIQTPALELQWLSDLVRMDRAHLSYQSLQDSTMPQDVLERQYLAMPSSERIASNLQAMTSKAHLAGTSQGKLSAYDVQRQWRTSLGLPAQLDDLVTVESGTTDSRRLMTQTSPKVDKIRAWTDTYYPLLNYPVLRSVKLCNASEVVFRAAMRENVFIEEDPTSATGNEDVPTFHGYSKNGSATGQYVYANYGRVEDFELLRSKGISVTDKIVLVRYGGVFRGLKVWLAQQAGASAVLIYTDPAEDGNITLANGHKAYPFGPAREPTSVQRGSVQLISVYPGDPLTPNKPAYEHAERLGADDPSSLVRIPSLPLSYVDALPLLQALEGRGQQLEGFSGALDLSYWTGPSELEIEVVNVVKGGVTPIYNTYAMIEGQIADEVVIVGNHRDAWVFGAADPSSGTAAVHEIVHGFAELMRQGWKPVRSILFASWDAEEYGLVGSTEAGEDFSQRSFGGTFFKDRVVTYLNVDVAASGSRLHIGASPSLTPFYEKLLSDLKIDAPPVAPLGSGSDFSVFLQHLGIASSDLGFARGAEDPIYHYHSQFDSFAWMNRFGDPGFTRHVKIAQVMGLAALRIAQPIILPINVTYYSNVLFDDFDRISKIARDFDAKADIGLAQLQNAVKALSRATTSFSKRASKLQSLTSLPHCSSRQARRVNSQLRTFESGFLARSGGLPGRKWYKHLGVAPGRYLGYGATTFPGVTEALTLDKDIKEARREVKRLVYALRKTARGLSR
ncbi:uncharacterized protein L969DRAFT_73038 [Mixia osmundae IAM 14324]|uniref:Uncharacterized protein n=1 Tax=Mixia osmundae (strain CBS 9802 / IAM 14324 / JCM 22182 / KY 12970) TaxID=764103 RepID=G7E9C4_MIXOS|nr:uncharacterized protein L969DRAFT_73038 [Mixia osmundae IAM 14324]KEI39870.1 hypothetical protein L969DRAFT_73038 [Mixia osmundae IAM 14324]GAA99243.1 hypothetical protein E5Q_05937 [Mixia osmundae IAM 14324]